MLAPVGIQFHLPSVAMPALKSPSGFTMIELLVVVAVIGVLMSLLFPAVQGALDSAKKAQAKNDAMQIATAIVAYDTEYGRLPDTNSAPLALSSNNFLGALTGSDTNLNPRKIIFLEVLNFKKGKGGILPNGDFVDPWAQPYYVALDDNYDNQVGVSTNGLTSVDTTIMKKVGVWNATTNRRQQVRSWD
jgi:prepilin-type N-terminal cleavage/methylation domain-containing protein